MKPKEKLYALLDDFYHNRMGIKQFCDLFSSTYDFEVDLDSLSNEEQELLGKLARMAYGYTDNIDDITTCPQYSFSDTQIVAKFEEIIQQLKLFVEIPQTTSKIKVSNELNEYYSIRPNSFRTLKKIEIQQCHLTGTGEALMLSVYLVKESDDGSQYLHLYFEKVRELKLIQPRYSCFDIFLTIYEDKGIHKYRVIDEEENSLEFYCDSFYFSITDSEGCKI